IYSGDEQAITAISSNTIANCDSGIVILGMNENKTTVQLNTITTNALSSSGGGILVTDAGSVDLTIGGGSAFINTINSNAKYGIYVSGFDGGSIEKNEVDITAASVGSEVYGIRGENLSNTLVINNTIDKQSGAAHPAKKRAISISDCSDYYIGCNDLHATE